MADGEDLDPREVAAALDALVEGAYEILAQCNQPGGTTAHQAINQLLLLFEGGAGLEARAKAEQLLRPDG